MQESGFQIEKKPKKERAIKKQQSQSDRKNRKECN
jgi:hypothetical protein